MQQLPASLKKHLELLKPSGAPWNTQLGLAQNPRLPSSTGRAMPGAQGTQLWHLRAEQGLGHRLPSPSQGQRAAGSSVLVLAQGAKGWSLISFCTQPDPKALLGVPAQPRAGGTCNQQEVLPVSGILTIPVLNSRHPVLFLLLKSEVLQLLLLSDAHQLLSSPCLSNSRH